MQDKKLHRLMQLSKRTGVPLIVSGDEEDFVLLGIDQFEALLSADEAELDDYSDDHFDEEETYLPPLEVYGDEPRDSSETPPETVDEPEESDVHSSIQHPAAPVEIEEENALPNVSSAVPEDMSHEEEERFYLEPID